MYIRGFTKFGSGFRTTSILVRTFWNFKLKVLKYSRNCSLHATLIPNLVKPLIYIYVIPTCKNFRHLSILKPSENQQRQPTANLPNRSNLMSLAASIPSSFKFFSICLLLVLETLSYADIAYPMIKRNYYSGIADCHQFSRGSRNWYAVKIKSMIQFCNSDSSFLVVCGTGGV